MVSSSLRLLLPKALALALTLVALALQALSPALAEGAKAFTDWEVSAFKGWQVSSLKVTGLKGDIADDIGEGLVLSGRRKFLGREKALLYEQTLNEDIRRARLFLARSGYPYAEIEPHFKPKRSDREVELTLQVKPGPPVVVDSVSVRGIPDHLMKEAEEKIAVAPRSTFVESKVEVT